MRRLSLRILLIRSLIFNIKGPINELNIEEPNIKGPINELNIEEPNIKGPINELNIEEPNIKGPINEHNINEPIKESINKDGPMNSKLSGSNDIEPQPKLDKQLQGSNDIEPQAVNSKLSGSNNEITNKEYKRPPVQFKGEDKVLTAEERKTVMEHIESYLYKKVPRKDLPYLDRKVLRTDIKSIEIFIEKPSKENVYYIAYLLCQDRVDTIYGVLMRLI